MSANVRDFMQALISLDRVGAKQIVDDLSPRIGPMKFVEEVAAAALERIGEGWQEGGVALSQVYMAGRICEDLVDEILPQEAPERKDHPKMAICVLGDHHKLGKAIVYSLLRASGYELTDYGAIDVNPLIKRIQGDGIKILLISVLMLPSALKIKQVRRKLDDMGLNVRILVGGAPFRFDEELWREVGADGMGRTASDAVALIESITGGPL